MDGCTADRASSSAAVRDTIHFADRRPVRAALSPRWSRSVCGL